MLSQVLAVVDAKGRVAFAQSPPLIGPEKGNELGG